MTQTEFFPFNPSRLRLGFLVGAIACVALTTVAFAAAGRGGAQPLELARAGLSFGMLLAFAVVFHKLRPRPEWGVQVTPLGVSIARPFSDAVLEVPWSAVDKVFRQGPKRDSVVLSGRRGQVSVARHLFESDAAFEALVQALEKHAPQPRYDA